ncbi:hypothetical protein L486_04200 [Kwoniella mangroviensis CBS 10435]|uniref:Uncharacterized protein n=1 Tax=Kwoniella mangroviensis CBS 10435 TaxID=1331196 RepID=A0A1B9IRS8_9TREE|nr:hypothetical protein L486_04200 [Kwoniella mangroviensis CBS 10435]
MRVGQGTRNTDYHLSDMGGDTRTPTGSAVTRDSLPSTVCEAETSRNSRVNTNTGSRSSSVFKTSRTLGCTLTRINRAGEPAEKGTILKFDFQDPLVLQDIVGMSQAQAINLPRGYLAYTDNLSEDDPKKKVFDAAKTLIDFLSNDDPSEPKGLVDQGYGTGISSVSKVRNPSTGIIGVIVRDDGSIISSILKQA